MSISVEDFYKNKTIFITGGSGYMGKLLIEKLLYSCSDLKEIIILVRPKRGKTAEMRVKEFETLPIFERIMKEKPEMLKKIYPVWGDIANPDFGLSQDHLNYIIENTQIIFHLAASLKLEAPLKTNVIMNLTAVQQVCDMARKMKNLEVMVHTSTAFCNFEYFHIDEKVYDTAEDPFEVIRKANTMSEKEMAAIEKKMLGKHLNSYTYTKRLAEVLVREVYNKENLPMCIVRPAMVHTAYAEPIVGYVDSLNGSPGVTIAAGRGVLRCLLMDSDCTKNFIPVDMCMSAHIMAAKYVATLKERPKDIPVYNLTAHASNTLTLGRYAKLAIDSRYDVALSFCLWYPNLEITKNKYYYYIYIALFQWIPALLIDFLLMIFRQKRFMIKIQQKLFNGINIMQCFLSHNFEFDTQNFESLIDIQSENEKKTFFIDTKKLDVEQYFRNGFRGGRIYLGHDPISTLPRSQTIYKIQYVVHMACKFFVYYWLVKKLLIMMNFIQA